METGREIPEGKQLDVATLRNTFHNVIKSHYPSLVGRTQFRLVPCPYLCTPSLRLLSSLDPSNFDQSTPHSGQEKQFHVHENFPLPVVPLFASSARNYQEESLQKTREKMNRVYREFLLSEEGKGFMGQVTPILSPLLFRTLILSPVCTHSTLNN